VTDARGSISVLRAAQDRLVGLAGPLGAETLRSPSYDDEWTIAQVFSHLGSQAEVFELFLDAAIDRDEPPGREAFPPIWDAWNLRSPEQQRTDCLTANERFVARLEALTDDAVDALHLSLFGMDLDAIGLIRMRLSELVLHTWDIAVTLDAEARLPEDAVAMLVDQLPATAGRLARPDGRTFELHVSTTAPERNLALLVADSVELSEWSAGLASAPSLRLPAESFIRLVYGRLDPEHTPTELVASEGTLDNLRAVFPGV
jgi:uncharacterized protein (TIGR03083 family)